uniref:Uncharacterized protein n=1 Tax=Meloidogyne incognita TaxID=6306 RepID=A0A914MA67_MELIC
MPDVLSDAQEHDCRHERFIPDLGPFDYLCVGATVRYCHKRAHSLATTRRVVGYNRVGAEPLPYVDVVEIQHD